MGREARFPHGRYSKCDEEHETLEEEDCEGLTERNPNIDILYP
jgi:hypothetical protein